MLQVLQSLKDGTAALRNLPAAKPSSSQVLSRTTASLISAGTERMLLDFGKANWIDKARQQPDKVRMVLEKARTDGVAATLQSVQAKLDQPIALGYSNAGVVLEAGSQAAMDFYPGNRVVSNGPHAEVVAVSRNLCARVPDSVNDDSAAFTVVAAIALQGIRLASPELGATVVVTGLGLIGLLAVQLLKAHGCRVVGIDFDSRKCRLAEQFGAQTVDLSQGHDPVAAAESFSRGRGVDAVLITAATKSNEPVHQAAVMCRKRGRIVLVGVSGLELARDDFYKKELTFQVSCSYGPGRYDPAYEEGQDYPAGFVRWTAQRNFEAVLDMMADGRLDVAPLITHRFPFADALNAYELLESREFSLGILLEYPAQPESELLRRRVSLREPSVVSSASAARLGFIGAGAYASKVLIPAFQQAGAELVSIASRGGLTAAHVGHKFRFAEATTDVDTLLESDRVDTCVVATRHDSHAALVCRALEANKHVFVEKPLALAEAELERIEALLHGPAASRLLVVGFNRRFAPHVVRMKQLLAGTRQPKAFIYTVNAGAIPPEHWTQDASAGGGRIAGEACHFIDLLRHLAGAPITGCHVTRLAADTVSIQLAFADQSVGTVHYFANGHKSFPKERLEVFTGGRILVLDNFRSLHGHGWPDLGSQKLWRQDKGANALAAAFVQAVRDGGPPPIPYEELLEVSRITLQAASA